MLIKMDTAHYIKMARISYIALIACTILRCSLQGEIIYHPHREIVATPSNIRLAYEDVFFRATDGTLLHGWYISHGENRATIIHCHGNAGNISHRLKIIEVLHSLKLNVFIFDYRGYGKSEGVPSEKGTYSDAEGAWNYVVYTKGISPERIIIHGHSLGGAIAAYLAHKKNAKLLILESTFVSTRALARDYCAGFVLLFPLLTYTYPTKEYLSKITIPVFIVHSREDEIIPFSHGEELYKALRGPKKFLEIRGDHNTGFLQSLMQYRQGIDEFITHHLENVK